MMSSLTSANPSNGVIILQGTQNYLEWLYTIEMSANSGTQDVLKYINPTRPIDQSSSIPTIPSDPVPSHIVSTATTITILDGAQSDVFKIRLAEWKEKNVEIEEIK
ncbi:hypothetical protein GcM3_218041 [Golovinomyces cichoracearum]|uniref:Uncharacterized protein n=1 Tax=Golovinomyces cichoracearum TaxID=62708 RepID=A0A420H7N5_9PEZI|nr:hypothetical protein GcM3_218041 [Golovinomyces cichoracearum]